MSVSFSTIVQRARPLPITQTSHALRDALAKLPPTTVSKLPNGVRVACEENPLAKFATVGLWLDVGYKHEQRHQNGLLKVLEQAGFQGTVNLDRKQLSRAIDETGGHLLVDVGRERSYFMLKCARDNVPKAVGLLSDVVRNARLSDADVAEAKKAVNKIRYESEELVDQLVMDNLHTVAFDATETGGLGLTPTGTTRSVDGLSVNDLKDFRSAHFTGPRTLLVGSGAVNHTQLEKLAQSFLGDLPSISKKPIISSRFVGGDMRLWNLRFKTAHIAWAFETCGASCADVVPLTLSTHIHGGFHRSQHELGQHAIHRVMKTFSSLDHGTPTNTPFPEKAIETLNSFSHFYEDTGLVGQYVVGRPAQTGPGDASSMYQLLQLSMVDFTRLAQKCVYDRELDQAKVNYKAQLLFNADGATNSNLDIGNQVLSIGRRVPLDEMYARIDDVTPTNVQETLQHYFYSRRPVLSMLGYLYPLPGYDALCFWMWKYWY